MSNADPIGTLRIGLIGSGFIAKFHVESLIAVRHAMVTGITSPTATHREALARRVDELGTGGSS